MLARDNIPPQYLLSSITAAPDMSTASTPWQADMGLIASAGNLYQINSTGGSSVWGGAGGGVSTATWFAGSNTTAGSSGTFNLSSIVFAGAGVISVKVTDGSVVVSGNAAAADGINVVMVGSNTSGGAATTSAGTNTTGTVSFIAGSNISLVQTDNSIVIYGAAGVGGIALQAGTQTATSGTVVLSGSNNVSFGMSNSSVVTARAWIQVADSAGLGPFISQLSFSEGNGVSMRYSATGGSVATIYGSHNAITTARASTDAVGLNTAQTNVTWTVNSSGLSLNAGGYAGTGFTSTSITGLDIKATHNTVGLSMAVPAYLTTQSAQAFSAGGASTTFQTMSYQDSNGISFSNNGGALRVTHALQFTSATSAITSNAVNTSVSASFALSQPPISRYENMALVGSLSGMSIVTSTGGSVSLGAAFMLPMDGSFGFYRVPVVMTTSSRASAFLGGNEGETQQAGMYSTWNLAMYKFGSGASSKSLMSHTTTSAGASQQFSISFGTVESLYSHSWAATFGFESASTSFSNSVALTSLSHRYFGDLSSDWTGFTGSKFMDLSFNCSLSAGNYFGLLGLTTGSSSSGGGANAYVTRGTDCGVRFFQMYGGPIVVNAGFAEMGNSSNASVGMQFFGNGAFSTAGGGTTAAIPFSNITTVANQLRPYFQLLRLA